MYKCNVCDGNCDCGELIGGICLECLEKQKQEQLLNTNFSKILNAPFSQMEINSFLDS